MSTTIDKKKIILYLLAFNGDTHFKFGFTNGVSRIQEVNRAHKDDLGEIDETRSLIVTAPKNYTIRNIENQLKDDYRHLIIVDSTRTGYTEIIPISYWNEVLRDILNWQRKASRQIRIFKMTETPYRISARRTVQKGATRRVLKPKEPKLIEPEEHIFPRGVFVFMQELGLSVIKQAYLSSNSSFTFSEEKNPGALSFCRWALITCKAKRGNMYYSYFGETFLSSDGSVKLNSTRWLSEDLKTGKFFELVNWARSRNELLLNFSLEKGEVKDDEFYYNLKKGTATNNIYNQELNVSRINEWFDEIEKVQKDIK